MQNTRKAVLRNLLLALANCSNDFGCDNNNNNNNNNNIIIITAIIYYPYSIPGIKFLHLSASSLIRVLSTLHCDADKVLGSNRGQDIDYY
jgi:hypothetical protein